MNVLISQNNTGFGSHCVCYCVEEIERREEAIKRVFYSEKWDSDWYLLQPRTLKHPRVILMSI